MVVSKPVSLRYMWYVGLVALFGSLCAYVKFTPIMDLTVLIVYIVIILFWIWLPILLMHWYMWSKDGQRN